MKFRAVTTDDSIFLFKMLEERDDTQNISHKTMPSFTDHIAFIKSEPYKEWFIISDEYNKDVGNYYITKNNEIGLFIKKCYQKLGAARATMKHILNTPGRYIANISPRNVRSLEFFTLQGFSLIQKTFEIEV